MPELQNSALLSACASLLPSHFGSLSTLHVGKDGRGTRRRAKSHLQSYLHLPALVRASSLEGGIPSSVDRWVLTSCPPFAAPRVPTSRAGISSSPCEGVARNGFDVVGFIPPQGTCISLETAVDPPDLFTVFGSWTGPQKLPKPIAWTLETCLQAALTNSCITHPSARVMCSEVKGWPSPQILVSAYHPTGTPRAVVLSVASDCQCVGVVSADVGATMFALQDAAACRFSVPQGFKATLYSVNGMPSTCHDRLPAFADVAEFGLTPSSSDDGCSATRPALQGNSPPGRASSLEGGIPSSAGTSMHRHLSAASRGLIPLYDGRMPDYETRPMAYHGRIFCT